MPSATPDGADRGHGIFLLTHPRSASNMFQKMLSEQPGLHTSGYNFYDGALAAYGQIGQGPLSSRSQADRDAIFQPYQASYERLTDAVATAKEKGLRPMLNEHALFLFGPEVVFHRFHKEDDLAPFVVQSKAAGPDSIHSNPTCLPDKDLVALQPIFQIRSPMLMLPSMVRAGMAAPYPYKIATDPCLSLRYSRAVYEWYAAQEGAATPLVIDADDIMNNRAAVRELCAKAGLDSDAIKYEWETTVEANPFKAKFMGTLNGSTGILPGLDSKGLDIETETAKWIEEFGEEDGRRLGDLVRATMLDYEYLLAHRVTGA